MIKINPTVAVIVCTIPSRRKQLLDCIHSIVQSSVQPEEIIVVCHEGDDIRLPQPVRVIKTKATGASDKKNSAIQLVSSDVIAFIDDDCVVSKTWVKNIKQIFYFNSGISGLCGSVKPYQPEKHNGLICPSTFYKPKNRIFTHPRVHQDIGSGNNMAFRREALVQLGRFKSWLGPGSVGKSADDAELIIRALGRGYKIMYRNSGAVVWHNRWLTSKEYEKQELEYILADTACYTYYLSTYSFARRRVYKRWMMNRWRYGHSVKLFLKRKISAGATSLIYSYNESVALIRGCVLGIFQSICVI
jgi:glycosyltransferase involved in cell wall biosynthesis